MPKVTIHPGSETLVKLAKKSFALIWMFSEDLARVTRWVCEKIARSIFVKMGTVEKVGRILWATLVIFLSCP
jgi:hypothetical protein